LSHCACTYKLNKQSLLYDYPLRCRNSPNPSPHFSPLIWTALITGQHCSKIMKPPQSYHCKWRNVYFKFIQTQ